MMMMTLMTLSIRQILLADQNNQESLEGQQWAKADYHDDDDPDEIINTSNTLSGSK